MYCKGRSLIYAASAVLSGIIFSFPLLEAAQELHDATQPDDPFFYYIGRTDISKPKEPKLYYSGSSITCNFEGTSVSATFSDFEYWGGGNKVEYFIDGKLLRIDSLENGGDNQTVAIASGLSGDSHLLQIYKVSGVESGYLTFHGLQLDEGKGLLAPPEPASRKMECYGTSVASGEHAGCPDGECGNDNGYNAYPLVFARRLDGEMYNNGITGLAVCNSTGYYESGLTGLERTWDKTCPANQSGLKRSEWDFTRFTPDLVLMGMGINDKKINHPAITKETFVTKYLEISLKLDSLYNGPLFLYCVDPLGNTTGAYFRLAKQVADSMKALGKRSYYYEYKEATSGGHPDSVESARMGNELADFVEQNNLLEISSVFRENGSEFAVNGRRSKVSIQQRASGVMLSVAQQGHYTVSLVNLDGSRMAFASTHLSKGSHPFQLPETACGYRICEVSSRSGVVASAGVVSGW